MLVYLNALTWRHSQAARADEIREAQRLGISLMFYHEFPSVLDPGSARAALAFKEIIDATPNDLKAAPPEQHLQADCCGAQKGGELRNVGLSILAMRLLGCEAHEGGDGRLGARQRRGVI
eukprot:4201380-Prymnesium_polylepis.1